MKIKIIKASKSNYWYADQIGNILDVTEYPLPGFYKKSISDNLCIDKNDCIIINCNSCKHSDENRNCDIPIELKNYGYSCWEEKENKMKTNNYEVICSKCGLSFYINNDDKKYRTCDRCGSRDYIKISKRKVVLDGSKGTIRITWPDLIQKGACMTSLKELADLGLEHNFIKTVEGFVAWLKDRNRISDIKWVEENFKNIDSENEICIDDCSSDKIYTFKYKNKVYMIKKTSAQKVEIFGLQSFRNTFILEKDTLTEVLIELINDNHLIIYQFNNEKEFLQWAISDEN
jgi:DNA-directed RNA polymerase subunit RPC12/RpoP